MNVYSTSALAAFAILIMGISSVLGGGYNAYSNKESKSGMQMFLVSVCVFFWDFGYAWMSLCYNDDFAYIPRAIALLAVTMYMFFIIIYVGTMTDYPVKRMYVFLAIFLVASLTAWTQIIQKSAVEFVMTPWGYWYNSTMSWARILQFASIMGAIVLYYFILAYGIKRAPNKRSKYILKKFIWFGPVLFIGYIFDTLGPSLFNIPAIPGSCISAFCSASVLFDISQKNKVFGLSETNVAEYVFEDVDIPVLITDEEGIIVLHNKYALKYLKCKESSLKKRTINDFLTRKDGGIIEVNGTDSLCKLDKTVVKDKFDELLYTIYFLHDVTNEEEALRVAEENRTLAEEANKAKSNFLANMSHEIRTPMNAIIGMSNMVLEDPTLSTETISKINDISSASNNLLGIINDVLDISKIEAGMYELIPDKYELPSLVHDVTNLIDARLYESVVKFEVVVDPSIPKQLIGDVGRVRQVLANILGNAVKFTKKGTISLIVNWNNNKTNPTLYFDVVDTGIGIKEEDVELIFDKFSQVDTRKNRSIQGTGLGLAISKHLCMLMDGDIFVESVYGEGSTFHIVIKQMVEEYVAIGDDIAKALGDHSYQNIVRKSAVEFAKRPNMKALLVDDTLINLKVASHLLKKYDMQVDTAESGRRAIAMVQANDYDIVFMDHMMPEMDGVEATKKIRSMGEKYEKLIIIALTANAVGDAKEMFIREGMQDFLAKPIDIKLLDDIMNKWLPVEES